MKPEPIYLRPGTYSIEGGLADRHIQELDRLIDRIQVMLGAELQRAMAGVGDPHPGEASAMISFTGAFTGLSSLLHFCSFTRGIITVERGMETRADLGLVTRFRNLMVPIVTSQCEILETSGRRPCGAGTRRPWPRWGPCTASSGWWPRVLDPR
jgi:hypothetical protein